MMFSFWLKIIIIGICEGILLRDNRSTGPKIIFGFSWYHLFLAVLFFLLCWPDRLRYIPLVIITQDFFSHGTEYFLMCRKYYFNFWNWKLMKAKFFSGWIMDLSMGKRFVFPAVYWVLGVIQWWLW